MDSKPSAFDTPVTEEIKERTWVCSSHGELDVEELGVSTDGTLLCEMCSAARIGSPNADIDPTVTMREFADENDYVLDV